MNRMKNMFTGAVALVAGMALSAGSAFATSGYVGGDPAMMKVVPYYETGDNKATIIGIQNMSPQEASTVALNADVTDIQAVLAGGTANANAGGLITGIMNGGSLCSETAPCGQGDTHDPTRTANAEAALETAMEAAYVEHTFVTVNVHDAMGMMMGSATLCLAENQFGYVVLQGPEMQDWQTEIPNRGMILSVMDGDIDESGYVMISAGTRKFDGCTATAPDGLTRVMTPTAGTPAMPTASTNRVASWAIIQDTGMGFFGTEVVTATLSMERTGDDASTTTVTEMGDPQLACYSSPDRLPDASASPAVVGRAANTAGDFMMTRCGLIPERHDNSRMADGAPAHNVSITGTEAERITARADNAATGEGFSATPRAHAFARYDIGDESMVYVWLAEGMDPEDVLPRDRRMLEVAVTCEDGMMPAGPDMDGDNQPDPVEVAAPGMLTMIDPAMGAVGDLTAMCEGDRGVLQIRMPDESTAGMVFTHITQMMGHYRMNFPAYSMANPVTCFELGGRAAGDTDMDGRITAPEVAVDIDGDGANNDFDGTTGDRLAAAMQACM